MRFLTHIVAFFSLSFSVGTAVLSDEVSRVPADPDVGKDMIEIISEKGYIVETHYVTTSDGYILTMFRIPNGKSGGAAVGSPVLLQHGLLDSSFTWVSNSEEESLGYILADQGFDVWFGNNRGNRYGRNHTTLDPDDGTETFWKFSWDEMAMVDAPTMIHYVLDHSESPSLGWVGHSEGTIQMFAAGSSVADSSDSYFTSAINSINIFVALAPVAYVSNQRSKILQLLAESNIPEDLYERGMYEFLPYGPIDQIAPEICQAIEKGCDVFLMTICGPTLNINASRIQVYVSNTPAGTSMQNMFHWMQGVLVPTFQKYDFGSDEENVNHYGVSTPPMYDLSKMAVKTALFYGKNDYLADMTDVQRIIDEMPSEMIVMQDYQDDYAHLDYTWAYNANTRIYGSVSTLLSEYSA